MTSSTLQLITACSLSLVTGIYIGQYISSPATQTNNNHNNKNKKNSTGKDSSSSNSSSEEVTAASQAQTSESESDYENENDDESDESSEEEDYLVNSKSLNDIPGETRLALVIRTDLKMTKGKVAAQCSHATLGAYRLMSMENSESENLPLLRRWERHGQAKITLQCKSKDDLDLLFAKAISLNVNAYMVRDAGRTQIEPGSITVLALGPAPKPVLDQITGDLKLY
ncbi:hypothetical protein WICPIJ_003798 [Wickerhamomyces pijperi]|uniref:peptidyl-tRNA hydrolase n=1 Tax=Wickerhamomyces pijperi TaxID=599730 RepID=A0A9P8TNI2_WICPI|nr:hypothetical protein WICPIJ_003798 [Wickerhamomyces pijperi]